MNYLEILIVSALFVIICCYKDEKNNERSYHRVKRVIIGGDDAIEGKYSHAMFISSAFTYCGASIVDRMWLLTAAHCVLFSRNNLIINLTNPYLWTARHGNEDSRNIRRSSYYLVRGIYLPGKYRTDQLEYDIALLKLNRPVTSIKERQLLKVPSKVAGTRWPIVERKCTIVGWGCTVHGKPQSQTAQMIEIPILHYERCQATFQRPIGNINKFHEFCAGYYHKSKGLCSGDSGSGLLCSFGRNLYIAGVLSAGLSGQSGDYPGIFTRVSYFQDWIRHTISHN